MLTVLMLKLMEETDPSNVLQALVILALILTCYINLSQMACLLKTIYVMWEYYVKIFCISFFVHVFLMRGSIAKGTEDIFLFIFKGVW